MRGVRNLSRQKALLSYFKIYTDHTAIIQALKNPLEKVHIKETRMLSFISQYDVEIIHIPGKEDEIADLLSGPN